MLRKGNPADLTRKTNTVVVTLPPLVKKSSKSRSFHFRYLELCRAKNLTPVPDIRSKSNSTTTYLELCGDKLAVSDWQLLTEALHYDLVLQQLVVRLRRSYPQTNIDPIDTEKRARLFRQRPVIYTRFIFNSLVQAIANCVSCNKNLNVLKLEGLPLHDGYIETIAKSLADNECLETVSFRKSNIGDKGCEVVCNTAKYLNRIEIFDLSECGLTSKGAEHVADMLKMQKITRFTEGWEKSLRYRSVDVNTIGGLRTVLLADNPEITDEGIRWITEVLKEDAWIKKIDMENCGLTDIGANLILDCLELNTAITEFSVRNNEGISKFLQRNIREHLGEPAEAKQEPEYDLSCVNGLQSLPKNKKVTVSQLLSHTKALEEQLSFERTLRKKAEKLNEKLSHQLMRSDSSNFVQEKVMEGGSQTHSGREYEARHEVMQEVVKDSQSYRQSHFNRLVNSAVTSAVTSAEVTPRSEQATLRKEQQLQQQSPSMQIKHLSLEHQLRSLREEVEEEEEEYEEEPPEGEESLSEAEHLTEEQHYQQQMQVQRKQLQVRKVRSEMKYVENNPKEAAAKNRESKSDHEFANERDFKLNSSVQFETDIGDSAIVNPGQHYEDRRYEGEKDTGYGYGYEQEAPGKRGYEKGYVVGVGDGSHRRQKPSSLAEALSQKRGGGFGDGGHVAQYVNSLERKANAAKPGKKRHKPRPEDNHQMPANEMQMESYMSNYEEISSTDVTLENSDFEAETTDSTLRGSARYSSMQSFVRRKNSESISVAEHHGEGEPGGGGEPGNTGSHRQISPREVYLSLQLQSQEPSS
ncbi:protein Cep78 homolog [Drosophila elegans]|uniref:protein Cep78 homolog n=1 Tax=Drosophila elegans TaxID=30023 RepID=UPI0007E67CDB|nr:protein Cep78 homolog [Drosophila elegans]XP_017117300.1 protein Cep78 homolog [Drosophila elegans]XP_041565673.1 protein Cep78 homolog [Drosophila elegans]